MIRHFYQSSWDAPLIDECTRLVHSAIDEDLQGQNDWTTLAIVPADAMATAEVVSREEGVFVGERVARLVAEIGKGKFEIESKLNDGDAISVRQTAMVFSGRAQDILSLERTILNFAGRLSGIATLTREFVGLTEGTRAVICDTRKTTPGWRRLEKYAVRCGGGTNHRMGLHDAILIKDNHLAFAYDRQSDWDAVMSGAISNAKQIAREQSFDSLTDERMIVEVEVDTIEQFKFVIDEGPDIILLDNMSSSQLTEAVSHRDQNYPNVALEASGGINLETVKAIAETGVDRISVGALTHSATNFDLGLDWK